MAKSKFTTKYTTAVHEAGHAVAACSVGFGMKKRGIVLEELKGTAYIRGPGRRSRNAKLREIYHQRNAVVSLAGPAAEYRVNEGLTHSDADVQTIACALRELLPCKQDYIERVLNCNDEWGDFWALVYILATITDRERAMTDLEMSAKEMSANIDVSIFNALWPFAQRAHAILDACWPSVEEISEGLLKTGSISGPEIESIVGFLQPK